MDIDNTIKCRFLKMNKLKIIRPSLSSVIEKFRISSRHAKNDILFVLLSAANDRGQKG
jgi:hypothetical protein